MKIEMGESLFYSWLRHVKECQIVQTNWKVSESVPTVVEFGEGGKRREWSKVLDHADSSVDQTPVSVNRPRADCRTGICRKPLIRRNPRSASRKPAAA